jgi:GT2 family glycosyltransferase
METINLAVLVACYNRREKTLKFLKSFVDQNIPQTLKFDIYLLDDGSTDGTSEAVKSQFPFVEILFGDSNLWWVGAMVKLWKYAIAQKSYDLFLLVNDDIVLFENAVSRLISNYLKLDKKGVILIGSTMDPTTKRWTYGGNRLKDINHVKYYPVEPHEEEFISCDLGNANFCLVDAATVERIGIFTDAYAHKYADFDYTLTAKKAGLNVLIAPGYYAFCEFDHGNNSHLGRWLSGKHPLTQRIKFLYKPNGLACKEYLHYAKKHFPRDYFSVFAKLWLKTFFPVIWDKFKKENKK